MKEVYIIFTDTGTWLTRMIRLFTRAPLNHASIAVDAEYHSVYSFGRKRHGNPFIGGFVKEDLRGKLFHNAECEIYKCKVQEQQYQKMLKIIAQFERDAHLYRYNFIGLLCVLFNIRLQRKHAYFCSQFVAHVMNQSGIQLVAKCPEHTTPCDIAQSECLELIYKGKLQLTRNSLSQAGTMLERT